MYMHMYLVSVRTRIQLQQCFSCMSPNIHSTEPYIRSKEPYIYSKEPFIYSQKSPASYLVWARER